MENTKDELDRNIGRSLKALRLAQGMTLDQLATTSGVSRGMISKVERGEASPTAVLLARMLAPLQETLSGFFARASETPSALHRYEEQGVWRDPETGYLRRAVSPAIAGMDVDLVEVELPAGAQVFLPPLAATPVQTQFVWLLNGRLTMEADGQRHEMNPGDCLYMTLGAPHSFSNTSDEPCRYAVILRKG